MATHSFLELNTNGSLIYSAQTIAIWFAYRMDVETLGVGNTVMAPGCRGTVGDGSCFFDEFLRYITPKWRGSTSVGTNLDPDVETTASDITQNSGYKFNVRQDKLFATKFAKGVQPNFGAFWAAVGDVIQSSRKTLGDSKVAQALSKARYCFTITHDARRSDMAPHMIKGVNDLISKQGQSFVRISSAILNTVSTCPT